MTPRQQAYEKTKTEEVSKKLDIMHQHLFEREQTVAQANEVAQQRHQAVQQQEDLAAQEFAQKVATFHNQQVQPRS